MKKKFALVPAACILMLAFSNCMAQSPANIVAFNQAPAITPENDLDAHQFTVTNPTGINVKAVRDFTQSFRLAENVHWYKVPDGVMVYFTENNIKTKAGYDKNGNWLYSLRSYAEKYLPRDVRARVKSIYYDYSITWVNEITKERQHTYLVQLQDNSSCKTIRVCEDEEMEVVEEFVK